MKFVVNRDLFTRALARIQGVVSRKATMPVLSNVLLEASGADQLRVAATDLDVTFDGQLAARTTEPGRITVDGKRLFEVVRSLPGEEVDVEVGDEERVTLRCKNTEFVLLGMSADSYPKLPSLDGLELVDADGSVLRELLERTMFSVSTDESRPNLNGVYFRCLGDDRIRMVSTDGHRLSQGERAAGRGAPIPERDGVIIPRKGVTELKRLLDEVGAEIAFGFLENNLVVSAGDLSLFVRLIDANFPDYRQVIPKSSERHVVLQRVPFLNSLKRIEILASERTHGVRIELAPGTMTLISNNPDLGSAREEVAIEGYDGGDLVIAFNAKYMREILGILSAEKVELALNEALSPGLIREHENQDYLFVVMPMRI
ncbi:MAG: DNA polymerase III subunit beta [Myxococcales bacterium]|nr:DNA polymerase III subunit beta [Myxococcales bacterium]